MNKMKFIITYILLSLALVFIGGNMALEADQLKAINDIPEDAWKKLSQYTIFFGHQSVGYNILEGINDVMKENKEFKLRVIETTNPNDLTTPAFAHSRVGENRLSQSKLDSFSEYLSNGIGKKTDIAFIKFCYVDINKGTDIEEMFDYYKTVMEDLKQKFPDVTFVHFTVPLTYDEKGIKATAKKILGRTVRGYGDNIKRNQYNELLKSEYGDKEPVFDIAAIESTALDGQRNARTKDGYTYYAMFEQYTDDGGHLNEQGRKIVAEQLLIFLSEL